MIKNLTIKNFIIVPELEIKFSNGFQVLTGETGAGKSIIIGALNLILGSKVNDNLLFNSQKSAYLEASFTVDSNNKNLVSLIEKYDLDIPEDEIFIAKKIGIDNRAKSYINGQRTTNKIIKEFASELIDFHSQRDQLLLLNKDYQLEIIDRFGSLDKIRDEFNSLYREFNKSKKDLNELINKEKSKKEKIELYKFQIKEIEEAELIIGEDKELDKEYNLLNHSEEILKMTSYIENAMDLSSNSTIENLRQYAADLGKFEDDVDNIKNAKSSIMEAIAFLEDSLSSLDSVKRSLDIDRFRKDEIESRIDELNRLKVKYNNDLEKILEYLEFISQEVDNYSSFEKKIKISKEKVEKLEKKLKKSAHNLSTLRKKISKKFEKEIEKNIPNLAIKDGRFSVKFNKKKKFSLNGIDEVDFYFSANIGKDLEVLSNAASGGELSRLLLSIKKILADKIETKTIVFDEIDSGIGGKTAEKVAEFIYSISKNHQVIAISHLPQIAAIADEHFAITKKNEHDFTAATIKKLNKKNKINEIARMLSGTKTDEALIHARKILSVRGNLK